ncbi:hypothetical protein SNEBB_007758 [Seison nebaliae]|nr:hypothetical protein SNEBB_007758 [Seison nebaliae]
MNNLKRSFFKFFNIHHNESTKQRRSRQQEVSKHSTSRLSLDSTFYTAENRLWKPILPTHLTGTSEEKLKNKCLSELDISKLVNERNRSIIPGNSVIIVVNEHNHIKKIFRENYTVEEI